MKADCILLYGNDLIPISKYAGTFRIATELRNHGYTVQCIDLTAYKTLDKDFLAVLDSLIGNNTLWIGMSTTFMYHVFGYPYYKSQSSFDKKYARALGVDVDKLLIYQPETQEEGYDMILALIEKDITSCIVIDSQSAATPKAVLQGEMGDATIGLQARINSKFCMK